MDEQTSKWASKQANKPANWLQLISKMENICDSVCKDMYKKTMCDMTAWIQTRVYCESETSKKKVKNEPEKDRKWKRQRIETFKKNIRWKCAKTFNEKRWIKRNKRMWNSYKKKMRVYNREHVKTEQEWEHGQAKENEN